MEEFYRRFTFINFVLLTFTVSTWAQPNTHVPSCGNALFVNNNLSDKDLLSDPNGNDLTKLSSRTTPIIWVVVHIVWHNEAENMADDQVHAQIDTLNRDFNGLNTAKERIPAEFRDVLATDGIQFCLAPETPEGYPSSGIIRRHTDVEAIGAKDELFSTVLGGSDAWDTRRFLNVWVADIGGLVTGFGIYPEAADSARDGVVINYRYFGSIDASGRYNLGRVAVHEIGHYLGLRHLWGEDDDCLTDDGIEDTPAQMFPYFGCPQYPQMSCEGSDMFMNFMDYVDDDCMLLFTKGQMNRMIQTLQVYRPGLITHTLSCEALFNHQASYLKIHPNPSAGCISILNSKSGPDIEVSGSVIDINGRLVRQFTVLTCQEVCLDIPHPGLYFVRLRVVESGYTESLRIIFMQ